MKIAIITDSTAYLPDELKNNPDVYIVHLSSSFPDGEVFADEIEEADAFYKKVEETGQIPTTSQPNSNEYFEVLDEIVEKGYDAAVAIHLANGLSGTYASAYSYAQEYSDRLDIRVVDSNCTSVILEYMVKNALSWIEEGASLDLIEERLNWTAKNSKIYLAVPDLNHLVRGGRLSRTRAAIGGILKMIPVVSVDLEGNVEIFDTIRSAKRVNQRLVDEVKAAAKKYPQGIQLAFAHADASEFAEKAVPQMLEDCKDVLTEEAPVRKLGPVIGTHVGRGGFGMGIIPRLPKELV